MAGEVPFIVRQIAAVPPPGGLAHIATGVERDPENPGFQVPHGRDLIPVSPALEKRVLVRIAGIFGVADHVNQQAQQFVLAAGKDFLQRFVGARTLGGLRFACCLDHAAPLLISTDESDRPAVFPPRKLFLP